MNVSVKDAAVLMKRLMYAAIARERYVMVACVILYQINALIVVPILKMKTNKKL